MCVQSIDVCVCAGLPVAQQKIYVLVLKNGGTGLATYELIINLKTL